MKMLRHMGSFGAQGSGRGRPIRESEPQQRAPASGAVLRAKRTTPVLKGRLRGYAVGLVQLLREVPCPDLMARHLLNRVLENFRESGHHYLMHLVAERDHVRRRGTAEEVSALDAKIHEHAIHEQIPKRWDLETLLSRTGYETYGDGVLAVWATILIEICTLEQHWERSLLGLPPQNPCLLPGFHSDEDVCDTAWLEEARQIWSGELRHLFPDAARVLAVVVTRCEPAYSEVEEPGQVQPEEAQAPDIRMEVDSDVSDRGRWVH